MTFALESRRIGGSIYGFHATLSTDLQNWATSMVWFDDYEHRIARDTAPEVPTTPSTDAAAPSEMVLISGADPVTGWSPNQGKVWKAAMPGDFYRSAINYADQVFVDGEMVLLARWPNGSPDLSAPAKSLVTAFVSKSRDKAANRA